MPPIDETVTPEEQQDLLDEEMVWVQLGQPALFDLALLDHKHKLKRLYEKTKIADLFDANEIAEKRAQLARAWEEKARFFLNDHLLGDSLFKRWRKKQRAPGSLAEVRLKYEKRGRLDEFQRLLDDWKRINAKENYISDELLFSREEKTARLQPQYQALKSELKTQLKEALDLFLQYEAHLNRLPADEIDNAIAHLQREFLTIGRKRDWYESFLTLMREALDAEPEGHSSGVNEPATRVLQQDFLSTMQRHFDLCLRYHKLRRLQLEPGQEKLAKLFSRPYSPGEATDKMLRPAQPLEALAEFVEKLEDAVETDFGLLTNQQANQASQTDRLLRWENFKQSYTRHPNDVVHAFNQLKPILIENEDWHQELRVFQSELKLKLKKSEFDKHSKHEIEVLEAKQFIERMMERVEAEIEMDVEFETLLQTLDPDDTYRDKLAMLERNLLDSNSSSRQQHRLDLLRFKAEVIESIKHARSNTTIVPLFNRK